VSTEVQAVNEEQIEINRRVPTGKLLAYATGLVGQNFTYGFIAGWLFYYLEYIRQISPKISGIITGISRVWDSINDPIIGGLIDKHKFKNGEKLRPILILTPPFIGVLAVLMFLPFNLNKSALIIMICVCYLLWDFFYSFQDVALWGMVAVSSPSSVERGRVAQWISIGAGAGSAIVSLFPSFRSAVEGMGVSSVYVFFIFAVIFGFGGEMLSMTAHKMPEVIETPKSEESLFEAIFVLRHNKTLMWISIARFFRDVFNTVLPWVYFFESREIYDLGITKIGYGNIQVIYGLMTGAVSAVAMLFATKMAGKLGGMKRLLLVAQASNIICRVISFFVGFNSPSRIFITMGLMAIANIPVNSMDIAHRSITTDSIDYVEYKTGKRTEGISFSIQNLVTKLASAVVQIVNGFVLSALGHDSNRKNFDQNPLYMKWQWPIFMLGPVIGAVIYTFFISFVKDDEEEKKMVEAALYERHHAADEKAEMLNK